MADLTRGHFWNCPQNPDRLANKYAEKGPCNCKRLVARTVYAIYRRRDEGFMINDFEDVFTTKEAAIEACGDKLIDPDKNARAEGLFVEDTVLYGVFEGEAEPPPLTDEDVAREEEIFEARRLMRIEP